MAWIEIRDAEEVRNLLFNLKVSTENQKLIIATENKKNHYNVQVQKINAKLNTINIAAINAQLSLPLNSKIYLLDHIKSTMFKVEKVSLIKGVLEVKVPKSYYKLAGNVENPISIYSESLGALNLVSLEKNMMSFSFNDVDNLLNTTGIIVDDITIESNGKLGKYNGIVVEVLRSKKNRDVKIVKLQRSNLEESQKDFLSILNQTLSL